MAEPSAMNSQEAQRSDVSAKVGEQCIKKEEDADAVSVKPEPHECVVCLTRTQHCFDIYTTTTVCGTRYSAFLCKYTHTTFAAATSKHICKGCHDLINVLEQAELDYLKLKETFEAIISKNPLFDQNANQVLTNVKIEANDYNDGSANDDDDSEDEPLALTKKKRNRKPVKRKKKVVAQKREPRRKVSNKDSWECPMCNAKGSGGAAALAAHQLAAHAVDDANPALRDVKKEESVDGSESSHFNNGLDNMEMDFGSDDDNDSYFTPDDLRNGDKKSCKKKNLVGRPSKSKSISTTKTRKKREIKVSHQCDQCDAKYTSLRRLEQHREKHAEGKPPYICEVCGARYKHKRACDIHVALHKGISDWKCEECNKLFPSKGALQRHNNIHTGKLNYQCDLCGKSFIHTSSFKMHKLSHSGVKPHACDVCGLALMTRSHLKRHKRVHSGEKRHECKVCGKRFSERYNLAAHAKSHESAPGEELPLQLPKRRLFRCTFCQERFERRYMLERHMSAVHGRTLERVPPTPRNTMSKLLKAQAQARNPAASTAHSAAMPLTPASDVMDTKEERSPDSRASSIIGHKLHLSSSSASVTASSWSGAYAAEFGLRHEFPH